jgi:hypothetical protein
MNNVRRHRRLAGSFLLAGAVAGYAVTAHLVAHAGDKKPKSTVTISELEKKKGPKPPSGATFTGTEAHPMVGELELPIQNAQVFEFTVKTQSGATVPVKWSYSPGQGTYMWATAPIECEDGTTIARGSFVMKVRDDGSGSYALGTRQCPVAHVYGCNFNSQRQDTQCGACAWNGTDLACTQD